MGKVGRKPLSKEELERRGSWRAKTRPASKPSDPTEKVPACPKWVAGRYAQAAWRRLAPVLFASGRLEKPDREAVARYCQIYQRWRDADAAITEHGLTAEHKSREGDVRLVPRPEVAIARQLAAELLKIEKEFGMTPTTRHSVAKPEEKKEAGDGDSRPALRVAK